MSKTALITGASSGIGKELARIHAEKGGNLIIVARRVEKLNDLKKELEQKYNVQVTTIGKDLSNTGAAKELYKEVKEANIQVDYLINNAGFGLRGKFHELSWDRQQQMIHLNMVALTELMYLFLPEMVSRNSGKILNTSSTASYLPGPLQAIYYASKAYVTFLGNAIDEELHDTNISVTTLMPGATETEFAKIADMDKTDPFKNTVSARSVAEDGYNAMLKGKLNIVSGLTFQQKMMVSMLPFTPKRVILKQVRKLQEV
ncbi:SDR family NAD(P)-dependent oxidoreductase [Aquimarina litoralis]|uniref:SDR family NAD(P)-dependent oxidoreductase n=1 Tax=Aquimarina litoralis TaxID=584605 RepID=UPI001C559810|nr:SDR family oxidoreductase [Aquimarina litoralis]MBW1299031.1 SDR family NAD(P)-dependent oxidoreductase [Aquimarina litoralis]